VPVSCLTSLRFVGNYSSSTSDCFFVFSFFRFYTVFLFSVFCFLFYCFLFSVVFVLKTTFNPFVGKVDLEVSSTRVIQK
jgi:hypothetical protein